MRIEATAGTREGRGPARIGQTPQSEALYRRAITSTESTAFKDAATAATIDGQEVGPFVGGGVVPLLVSVGERVEQGKVVGGLLVV